MFESHLLLLKTSFLEVVLYFREDSELEAKIKFFIENCNYNHSS